MKNSKKSITLASLITFVFIGFACTKEVQSRPNFIFKPAPSKEAALKFKGNIISSEKVFEGLEGEIFKKEKELYDLKMAKIKSYLIQSYVDAHPQKKGLTNDQFLNQVIAKDVKISEKEIQDFIKERKISHVNAELKERIKNFLIGPKKREVIEAWLGKQMKNDPVEIYINKPRRPVFDVKVGDAPWTGGKNAKVTIVEFADFQCSACAHATKVVKQIQKKYGNKVKIVFKNFPLAFHKDAFKAAEAGLCAQEQGNQYFWKMYDSMFADQAGLQVEGLKDKAKKAGLDMKKFSSCLDSSKFAGKVKDTLDEGQKVSVRSTPTFYVNGVQMSGAQPIEIFSEVIDEELAK